MERLIEWDTNHLCVEVHAEGVTVDIYANGDIRVTPSSGVTVPQVKISRGGRLIEYAGTSIRKMLSNPPKLILHTPDEGATVKFF